MTFPAYPEYKDSGVEWLGEVPAQWEIQKFRYLFQESGEKIDRDVIGEMLSVSGYRGIEIKQYEDDNKRRNADELVGYRVVRPGQLVVNTMWLNYAGLGISSHEGHVSPAYRSYWVDSSLKKGFVHHLMRSNSYVNGYKKHLTGIRPNSLQMSRDDLMSLPVLLPSFAEQKDIAAFLDHETARIDALVEKQQRLIALLKEKRQAVISHAVTKGLDPDVPMKDSGVEWLGEVPAHWDVASLKRFWSVTDCKHITANFVDDGMPLASIREVQERYVDLSRAKKTTEFFYEQLIESGRRPEEGNLVFSRNATVGEVAQVAAWHPPFAMGQDVCLMKKLSDDYSSDYFQAVLKSPLTMAQLENLMIGSTFKRVNVDDIRGLLVPAPPAHEQKLIAGFLNDSIIKIDRLEQEAIFAIELMKEHRSALISAAVTGKIDVRGWTPPAGSAPAQQEARMEAV